MVLPSTGVGSNLKSPVWKIVPAGVRMTSPTASGMLWLTAIGSISKGPRLGALAFADGVLDDPAEHAVLFELDGDQAQRERRAVDRDGVVRVELHDEVRQPADVVLVAVGEQDAEQPVESLADVAVVAHDQVDAVQLGLGEFDARVDDDQVVAELDQRRVLANLANAAERADAYARPQLLAM